MAHSPEHILTVSEYTQEVKHLLEQGMPPCWVRGEVSNLRKQGSGHLYFTLKDARSQVSCVVFRGDALRLSVELKDGIQILLYGEISVYEPRGAYQIVGRIVLGEGKGGLREEFEKLKNQLSAEGLFDSARKKTIPLLPRTIGFITSPSGAAIQDFISIMKRRSWRGRLVVLPAQVQGKTAAAEIVEQIKRAEAMGCFDLLIVGRGGGSLEDLWAFNEEPLVREIARCRIPVISAVGHEIDFTLSDFAADLRAETPSAAAEYILRNYAECINQVEMLISRMRGASPRARLEHIALRLDDLGTRIYLATQIALKGKRKVLDEIMITFRELSPEGKVAFLRERLDQVRTRLGNASVDCVLSRGFALVKDEKGNYIREKRSLSCGQRITNIFTDGSVAVVVSSVEK